LGGGLTARLSDRPLASPSKELRSGLSLGRMDLDELEGFGRSRRLSRSGRRRKQACNPGTGLAEVGQHGHGMRTIDIELGQWFNPK
jgi:hypothetical protein